MPGMVDKKKGLVINLSSAMAIMPSPLFVVYAASKVIFSLLKSNECLLYVSFSDSFQF